MFSDAINDDEKKEDDEDHKASLLDNVAEYEAKRIATHPVATIQGDTSHRYHDNPIDIELYHVQ